jgi:multiple sugar transport system substrate-binding protein
MELLDYSPPDILSMSWYERVRPYAAGKVAMAYGYTLLAPYFELDDNSPPMATPATCRIRTDPRARRSRRSAAMRCASRRTSPRNASNDVVEALVAFTSPAAQKLYVQNGSRTAPRYSVGADPEVRRLSPIFEAVDQMSWRDELQFWPRPPIPQISGIIDLCGKSFTTCCAGRDAARALDRTQAAAERHSENQSIREEDMDPDRLKGKNILITGAAPRHGRRQCRGLCRAGGQCLPRRP